MAIETLCFGPIFGPIFGNISPVGLKPIKILFRQTYLCKTTSNKAKKKNVVLTVNILGNNVGRIFINLPYNGIFSCRQIFAVLSQKHGDYFSRILIFASGNVREK